MKEKKNRLKQLIKEIMIVKIKNFLIENRLHRLEKLKIYVHDRTYRIFHEQPKIRNSLLKTNKLPWSFRECERFFTIG